MDFTSEPSKTSSCGQGAVCESAANRDPTAARVTSFIGVENPLNRRAPTGADRDPTKTLIIGIEQRGSSKRERGPGSVLIHRLLAWRRSATRQTPLMRRHSDREVPVGTPIGLSGHRADRNRIIARRERRGHRDELVSGNAKKTRRKPSFKMRLAYIAAAEAFS
jgi:hypothetical protein